MTGYFCPVEGCEKHEDEWDDDQPPLGSLEAVRGHINAMSDDDHLQARDDGAWSEAPEAPEDGDDEGDETDDEEADDQEESSDEEATDQPDEGGEDSLEGDDPMVNQEEYEQQQTGTAGSEADDDQPETTTDQPDEGGEGGLLPSVGGAVPELSPMTTFVIICGVFAAIIIWRVYSARSSEPALEATVDDEDEQETQTTGMTMIEQ